MSNTKISTLPPAQLSYTPSPLGMDEAIGADNTPNPHWQNLLERLKTMGSEALVERQIKAQRILRDDGATYNIYDDANVPSQTWGLDLIPALISSEEWSIIESGLLERAELLNALLKDIYGSREMVRHGILPPEALFAHPGFLRPCHGIQMTGEHELIIHATDLMRREDGSMCVLTDRTQAPSGMGYALENRTVMSRVLPSLFRDSQAHRLAAFFQRLRHKLSSMCATHEQPRIVLLSPGAHNETYFEHAYLANYMGLPLVQSGDLVVRNGFVWMRSLNGLSRVDVILRRVDDSFCDPVELRSDSQLGVPNLLEVVRAGRVSIANPLGSGILESPVLLKYLPAMSKALLGREPRMQSVDTYWCAIGEDLKYVKNNLDNLVIKPVYRGFGEKSVRPNELTLSEKKQLLERIQAKPSAYIAQPVLMPTHAPSLINGQLQPRPAILRSFAIACDTSYTLMPGGLTRVGLQEGSFIISNQAGAQSKDTWVIASEPETDSAAEMAADTSQTATDAQLLSLPSRVVENLFWMGRYAERAEASLRMLRTTFMMLNGEQPISDISRRHLLEAVTGVTGTQPGFINCTPEVLASADDELLQLVKDPQRAGSVHFSLNAMLRSADESKELLSSDTLRVINDIRDILDELDGALKSGMNAAPEEALDPLVTALMALAGLAQESMVRGIGWQFMEIGRRIERAIQTAVVLDHLLTPVVSENDQKVMMESLLLTVEALISYRRRYRARIGTSQALELVMMDTSNPRSLLYQFDRLKSHIATLPRGKASIELSQEERTVLAAETRIRLSSIHALRHVETGQRPELIALLKEVQEMLGTLSINISDKYFDHRVGPQQLVRSSWEP